VKAGAGGGVRGELGRGRLLGREARRRGRLAWAGLEAGGKRREKEITFLFAK